MTTDPSKAKNNLIKDLKSIPSPVFYIFAAVAVFSGLYVRGLNSIGIFTTLFLLMLVACAAADINKGIVPDLVCIAIAILGIANYLVNEPVSLDTAISHLIGVIIISVPMLIVSLLVKGAFGGGDIKLTAAAGLYLGWKFMIAGIVVASFASGLYVIYLLLFKKAKIKSKIRIAAFLAYGLGVAALFGEVILRLLFRW